MTSKSTNDRSGKDEVDRRQPFSSTSAHEEARTQESSSSSATSPPTTSSSRHRGRQDLVGTHYRLSTEMGFSRWAQQHLADLDLGIAQQPQRPPRRGRRRAGREGGQQPRRRDSSSESGGDTDVDTEGQ